MHPRRSPDPHHHRRQATPQAQAVPPQASSTPGLRPSASLLPVTWNHASRMTQPNQPGQSLQHSGAVASPPVRWAHARQPGQPPTARSLQPTNLAASIPPVQMPHASRAVQSKVMVPAPPARPAASIPPVRMPHDTRTSQHAGNGANPTAAIQRHIPQVTQRSRPAVSIPPVRMLHGTPAHAGDAHRAVSTPSNPGASSARARHSSPPRLPERVATIQRALNTQTELGKSTKDTKSYPNLRFDNLATMNSGSRERDLKRHKEGYLQYFTTQIKKEFKVTKGGDGCLVRNGCKLAPGVYGYVVSPKGSLYAISEENDSADKERLRELGSTARAGSRDAASRCGPLGLPPSALPTVSATPDANMSPCCYEVCRAAPQLRPSDTSPGACCGAGRRPSVPCASDRGGRREGAASRGRLLWCGAERAGWKDTCRKAPAAVPQVTGSVYPVIHPARGSGAGGPQRCVPWRGWHGAEGRFRDRGALMAHGGMAGTHGRSAAWIV